MVDLRDHVGKRGKQLQRIRSRVIGSQGKIRQRIEGLTSTSITIYKSTVVVIGPEEGLALARQAVDMIAGGGTRDRAQLPRANHAEESTRRRSLETIELREEGDYDSTGFENLVPGLDVAVSDATGASAPPS